MYLSFYLPRFHEIPKYLMYKYQGKHEIFLIKMMFSNYNKRGKHSSGRHTCMPVKFELLAMAGWPKSEAILVNISDFTSEYLCNTLKQED